MHLHDESIDVLGYIVGADEIHVDEEKVRASHYRAYYGVHEEGQIHMGRGGWHQFRYH